MVIACILLAFILIVFFLIAPSRPKYEQRKPFFHRNFAHRGLHTQDKTVPENSLAAFQAAVAAGYGIELDIQLTADGQIVVFHDDTLERVCGVSGRVDSYTYAQLQEFSLCGTTQKIPLFTEVLRTVNGNVPLIIELKTGPHNLELCEKAWALLLPYTGSFCIESFDPRIVLWFRFHAKQVLRGQLASTYKELVQYQSPVISFAVSRCLTNVLARPHFIAYSKKRSSWCARLAVALGALPVVWTVRPGDNVEQLQATNDALIFEFYTPRIRY